MYRKGIGAKPSPLFSTPAGSGSVALDDLTDVTISSATIYDHLEYNGSAWVNTQNMRFASAAQCQFGATTNYISGTATVLTIDANTRISVLEDIRMDSSKKIEFQSATDYIQWNGGPLKYLAASRHEFHVSATQEARFTTDALIFDPASASFQPTFAWSTANNLLLYDTFSAAEICRWSLSGQLMAGTKYVAFNAATEKISGDGAGTLIFDAATSHAWKFGGVSNTSITNTTLTGPPSWTVKSTNAIAFDSGLGSMTFLVNATLEGTLTSAGLKLETDNYVSFQSGTTEKIWSSAASTLDLTANTTMAFKIAAAPEMTLTADKLTFNNENGGDNEDSYLAWDTVKQLDVGFISAYAGGGEDPLTPPGSQDWFSFTTYEGSTLESSKMIFRGYNFIGISEVAHLIGEYNSSLDKILYLYVGGDEFFQCSRTSAGVLSLEILGSFATMSYANGLHFSPNSLTSQFRIYEKAANDWTLATSGTSAQTISIRPSGQAEMVFFSGATTSLFMSTSTACTAYSLRMTASTAHTFNITTNGAGALTLNLGNSTSTVNLVSSSDWSFTSSTLTIGDGNNIVINTTTGTKIGTGATQKIGFWNATPAVQSTGYAITNKTSDKTLDCNATSIDELADVLGTLIDDLKTYGILGA